MRKIDLIVIHHTATDYQANETDTDGEKIFESIKRQHHERAVKEGWGDNYVMDYHFVVGRTGKVFVGQPVEQVAFHCGNYAKNLTSIAVCFLGNLEKYPPSKEQIDAGVKLVQELVGDYNVKTILKHKDIVNTDCPGKYFPWDTFIKKVFSSDFDKESDESWKWCIDNGIFKPDNTSDYATRPISRKEFAVFLKRFYNIIGGKNV